MPLIRRRAKLDPADRALIAMAVSAVERQQRACMVVGGDTIRVTAPYTDEITLAHLREVVGDADRADWPELIYDDVMRSLALLETGHTVGVDLGDFDAVRPLLRTRVYPRTLVTADLVAWEYAPELAEVLAVQLDNTLLTVTAERAASWPVGDDDLLDLGRAGVRELGPLTATDHTARGVTLRELRADTVFAPVHAAWLEDYLDGLRTDPDGPVYVAAPAPDRLLAHVAKPSAAPPAVLKDLAIRMYRDAPGRLTPDVLGWSDGILDALG